MSVWSPRYDHSSCMVRVPKGSCSITLSRLRGSLESKSGLPAGWLGHGSNMSYQYHSIKFDFPVTMQSSTPLESADLNGQPSENPRFLSKQFLGKVNLYERYRHTCICDGAISKTLYQRFTWVLPHRLNQT